MVEKITKTFNYGPEILLSDKITYSETVCDEEFEYFDITFIVDKFHFENHFKMDDMTYSCVYVYHNGKKIESLIHYCNSHFDPIQMCYHICINTRHYLSDGIEAQERKIKKAGQITTKKFIFLDI